jgi:hypothetical protein
MRVVRVIIAVTPAGLKGLTSSHVCA